jgi:hypothetical protein
VRVGPGRFVYAPEPRTGGGGLRFIDPGAASGPAVRHVAPAGFNRATNCPICSPSGDSCAFVDTPPYGSEAPRKIFLVRFGEDGPAEPELLFESNNEVTLVLVRP